MFPPPPRWGLYEPSTEHDACGVGFVAHIQGQKSRDIVEQALVILRRLSHRAATGSDPETGDGAGMLVQILLGTVWTLFHILIISLQAYIFMTLTVVYMAMAADHH